MIVFVSSTYSDLSTHRNTLEASLRMSGYDYNGMEHFSATPTPPLRVCLDAVRRSDVFVGILGMKYGACPNNRKLSYTEREYRLAYILRKPIFMFLIDETSARIRPQDFEINVGKLERLNEFKEMVTRRHTIVRFIDKDHLAWQVLASLRYEEMLTGGMI